MNKYKFLTPVINGVIKRNACGTASKKGLILGCYNGCSPGEFKFTKVAEEFDNQVNGKLSQLLKGSGVPLGEAMMFTNVTEDFYAVAVGGLGEEGAGYNSLERLNQCRENIRIASGSAARKLQDYGVTALFVEDFGSIECAAEGSALAVWQYQDLKSPDKKQPNPSVEPYKDPDPDGWQKGMARAEAQNLARYVEEIPSNLMTPTGFAEQCLEALCGCGVQVDARDRDWITANKMNALLAVANTSCEEPVFLELKYCGADPTAPPVMLVGKGITYDTGGLCLKNKHVMSEYRGDMAGAAVILGTMRCIARMALPINVLGLVPVYENTIGGMATKPGDVVKASNGKTIRITDTDNEGRIIMADALLHTKFVKPCLIGSIATLTPGIRSTLGSAAAGLFTNSEEIWAQFDLAGSETGDRLWRMPSFWEVYHRKITDSGVDIINVGCQPGNSAQAACFLKEFVPYEKMDFFHADITGVGMLSTGVGHPYLRAGVMTGRPTRTMIQFLYQIACPHDPPVC